MKAGVSGLLVGEILSFWGCWWKGKHWVRRKAEREIFFRCLRLLISGPDDRPTTLRGLFLLMISVRLSFVPGHLSSEPRSACWILADPSAPIFATSDYSLWPMFGAFVVGCVISLPPQVRMPSGLA